MTHNELKQSALQKPEVQAAYEALEPEFALLRQMLQARQEVGISQAEIAARLESSPLLSHGKHSQIENQSLS